MSDIAKRVGVNTSTVSKALKDSMDLNPETKETIRRIAKELNYVKKADNASNKSIGVICPEIRSNYYVQLVSAIEGCLKQNGYSMVIGFSNFKHEDETYYLTHFAGNEVDGIIFITENEDINPLLGNLNKKLNKPLVLIASQSENQQYDCIRIDDALGVEMLAGHLTSLGHTDIAFIGDNLTRNRLEVFLSTLGKHNVKADGNLVKVSEDRFEKCGYDKMKEILRGSRIPTAVIAAYDNIAVGAMRAISEEGLRIPEDISIAGIDNIEAAKYLSKTLTTVSFPVAEMGNTAVEIILKKINNTNYKAVMHIALKPELLAGESTGRHNTKQPYTKAGK